MRSLFANAYHDIQVTELFRLSCHTTLGEEVQPMIANRKLGKLDKNRFPWFN